MGRRAEMKESPLGWRNLRTSPLDCVPQEFRAHVFFFPAVSPAPGIVPSTGLVLKADVLHEYMIERMNFGVNH